MTDLHSHILPNVDDGASTVEESIMLLRAQLEDGVHTVALTPHLYPSFMEKSSFIKRRSHAFEKLKDAVQRENLPIRLILGAEVAFSTNLPKFDLDALCYEGTKTILIELPWDYYPPYSRDAFFELILKGYTPLIAHVERYPYFKNDFRLLEDFVQGGALAQVNAESIIYGGSACKRVFRLISEGLAHVLASDTHSVYSRPPFLAEAVRVVERKFGSDVALGLVSGLGDLELGMKVQ